MAAGSLAHALRHYFGKGKFALEIGIETVSWGVWIVAYYAHLMEHVPFSLHFVKMYPFFALGTFYFSHSRFRELITKNEICLALAVMGYIGSFVLPNMPVNLHGFFAIVIFLQLFVKYDASMPRRLSTVGTYSLEIYVFHWFMLPQLSGVCPLLVGQSGLTLDNGNFVILLVVAGAIAACIAALCIAVAKVIQSSRVLQRICFGG